MNKCVVMPTPLLYAMTVLIWGSTWYVLTFQLGVVPHAYSVAYRFSLASLGLFAWLMLKKHPLSYSKKDHFFFLLQGLSTYSLSYFFVYEAATYISSGVNSLLFSLIIVLNVFWVCLFYKKPITTKLILGACLGVFGMVLIFLPEVKNLNFSDKELKGMSLCLVSVLISSFTSTIGERHHKHGIKVASSNAYSMLYGALVSFIYAAWSHGTPVFDFRLPYVISLVYLSLFGSIITFGAYMVLIGRIGGERAGYPLVMISLVSLAISAIFENTQWPMTALFGVPFIILGNFFVADRHRPHFFRKPEA